MTSDFFEVRDRLRARRAVRGGHAIKLEDTTAEQLGEHGFLTEVAGRVILTAPAKQFSAADELPKELATRWQEKAAGGNEHFTWIQGRFVEAEKANRNGAFWSTEDLQFGEMSVTHGPLNWLHDEKTVIGTIADNALIHPGREQASFHEQLTQMAGVTFDAQVDQYTINAETFAGITPEMLKAGWVPPSTTANLLGNSMPRPYMAAVSAIWNWVHPDRAEAVHVASEEGRLWYSMECIGREVSCQTDETHEGCGASFDYVTAMTNPGKTCEHMQGRTSARRIVDPTFLGGAVIVPPAAPGWGAANAEVMKQVAALTEVAYSAGAGLSDAEWTSLMGQVLRFASS